MSDNSGLTSDMSLSEQVEQALLANPTTSGHPLSVAAEGGLITLTGRVPNQGVKDEAIRAARSVGGVADVVDDVTVGDDDRGGLFGLGGDDDGADNGDDGRDRGLGIPLAGAAAAGLGTGGTPGAGGGAPLAGAAIVGSEGLTEEGGDTTRGERGDDNTSMDDWQG